MARREIDNPTIRIHPPNTTPEEVERILKEVQRICWEIWDSLPEEVKRREIDGTSVVAHPDCVDYPARTHQRVASGA